MLDNRRVRQVTLVPAAGGSLSARVLARALIGRGIPAVVSSVDQLEPSTTEEAPHVVLVDAAAPAKQVEQTCHAVRDALPAAKLILLHSDDPLPHLLTRGLADGAISRTAGLDGLIGVMVAAGRRRQSGTSRRRIPPQRDEAHQAIASLTAREKEVLRQVATGASNHDVARSLNISPHTVRTHVQNVLAKLGAENRLVATAMARRAGILPGGPDEARMFAVTGR